MSVCAAIGPITLFVAEVCCCSFHLRSPAFGVYRFIYCPFPKDSSPPDVSAAFVSAVQTDVETFAVSWGGFYDPESNVKGYTLCAGTSAGAQDVATCREVDKDKSRLLTQLDYTSADGNTLVYFTVYAENGEYLESSVSTSSVWSVELPLVSDWAVRNPKDESWTSQGIIKQGDPHSIRVAIGAITSQRSVVMVEIAVGHGPASYQDAQVWTELPFPYDRTEGELWEYTLSGLNLEHGQEYYVHIRVTDDEGLQGVTTLPTRIFIDITPAVGVVRPHNGASIMLEYILEWLPLDEPDPEFSATYWMVGASWEFTDAEGTELAECVAELHDAQHGHPDTPIATVEAPAEATSALFENLKLQHLSEYEVVVKCRNVADVWGEATSERIKIDKTRPTVIQALDLTAPQVTGVLSKNQTTTRRQPVLLTELGKRDVELDYTLSFSELTVGFAAWDIDSGITHVMVAVGTAPGSTSELPWTYATLKTSRQAVIPMDSSLLSIHRRYYVSVTAVNVR